MLGDGGLERSGVADHGDGLEAEPFQQAGESLAEQDPVLGQDYPDRGWLCGARNLHAQ